MPNLKIMNVKSILITLFIYFAFLSVSFSQDDNYGIQMQQTYKTEENNCSCCKSAFSQKAKEVKFSIKRENNNLYFHVNDKRWFNMLFKNNADGVAVDIVDKERYNCETVVAANM